MRMERCGIEPASDNVRVSSLRRLWGRGRKVPWLSSVERQEEIVRGDAVVADDDAGGRGTEMLALSIPSAAARSKMSTVTLTPLDELEVGAVRI